MAIISNGTTVASGGTVQGSASNLSGIPAPSNSAILTGVASVSAGGVGSYAALHYSQNGGYNQGHTNSGQLQFVSFSGYTGQSASGTWRQMGYHPDENSYEKKSTVWLRIS